MPLSPRCQLIERGAVAGRGVDDVVSSRHRRLA
jgi:hypothetical protein